MPDVYLFLIACDLNDDDARNAKAAAALAEFGDLAPMLSGSWLLSVDADSADAADLNAGSMLEHLLDVVGEDVRISVIEVDNIATYGIHDDGESLLDRLFPLEEDEEE